MQKTGMVKIRSLKNNNWGYFFIFPALTVLTVFGFIPLLLAAKRAFQDYNTGIWVGLNNFDYVIKSPAFVKSFLNILLFTGIIVPTQLVLSFFLAQLIRNINGSLSSLMKMIVYVPCLISSVIVSIIFNLLTNSGGGLFANLRIINGKWPIIFQSQGIWPYISIIVTDLWLGLGTTSLIMLAGILNIPREYYEAARVDGAGPARIVFNITLPNLKNSLIFLLVTQVTGKLQMLDLPLLITGGGPNNKTLTPVLYLYRLFNDGSGAPRNASIAGSFLVMLVIVTLNAIAFRFIQSKKSEDV